MSNAESIPTWPATDKLAAIKSSQRKHELAPHRVAKASSFFERLRAARLSGGCTRCGKNHSGKHKTCDVCRERNALYKARKSAGRDLHDPARAIAMMMQCRREVSHLRGMIKQMQRAIRYKQARDYRRKNLFKRVLNKYADAYPSITKQELSEINHAYDNERA